MTKSELISIIAKKNLLTKKEVNTVLSSMIDTISDTLAKGKKVTISGFGTFDVRNHAEKNTINPATKKPVVIPAKKVPAFKASKILKETVNK